ncbi:hypothetical protein D9M71_620570 [compost metagenome]
MTTLYTVTNDQDRPLEYWVITEQGTRVMVILQPGAYLQLITSNKEDANILSREITGISAH